VGCAAVRFGLYIGVRGAECAWWFGSLRVVRRMWEFQAETCVPFLYTIPNHEAIPQLGTICRKSLLIGWLGLYPEFGSCPAIRTAGSHEHRHQTSAQRR
jgi:hypothetical protein